MGTGLGHSYNLHDTLVVTLNSNVPLQNGSEISTEHLFTESHIYWANRGISNRLIKQFDISGDNSIKFIAYKTVGFIRGYAQVNKIAFAKPIDFITDIDTLIYPDAKEITAVFHLDNPILFDNTALVRVAGRFPSSYTNLEFILKYKNWDDISAATQVKRKSWKATRYK